MAHIYFVVSSKNSQLSFHKVAQLALTSFSLANCWTFESNFILNFPVDVDLWLRPSNESHQNLVSAAITVTITFQPMISRIAINFVLIVDGNDFYAANSFSLII